MKGLLILTGLFSAAFLAGLATTEREAGSIRNGAEPTYGWQKLCESCHVCRYPTTENPCLLQCPRDAMATVFGELTQGPPVVLLDQLSEQYVPVIFAHQLHAEMTQMGEGCVLCHHHNPPGMILACRDCHGGPENPRDLRRPGLKGAYHRQCLGCHREWSHETACGVCHAKKTADSPDIVVPDPTDIMGILHPNVEEPDTVVFDTAYDEGPVVTFHHDEHVHAFEFKCVRCHTKDNCIKCHDPLVGTGEPKTLAEHHRPCYDCHRDEDGCGMCHSDDAHGPFDHNVTGWPLNRFHVDLECRNCHQGELRFESLAATCTDCHEGWDEGDFDHASTGLLLDEMHGDLECIDCHVDKRFDRSPSCLECHDEEESFPARIPGERIESKGGAK